MRTVIVWSDKEVLAGATAKTISTICNNSLRAVTVLGEDELFGILRETGSFDIPPHIMVWFSQRIAPQWVVQTVRWLRESLFWEGGIVVIVRSKEDQLEMERTCLFGEKDARFSFAGTPGHQAISEPIQLPFLLNVIPDVGEISMETWDNLLDMSILGGINIMVNNAKKSCDNEDMQASIGIMQEIFEKIHLINWPMLVAHKNEPLVKSILSKYPCDRVFTLSDYDQAIQNVQQLLKLAGVK